MRKTEYGTASTVTRGGGKTGMLCFPLEGNGARASHQGPGWGGEDDPMFTLNGVEKHAVAAIGIDVYNQEITGEIAASITAASGGTNTSGPKVIERCERQ